MKNEIGNRNGSLTVIRWEFIPGCIGQMNRLQKCAADDCDHIFPKLYYHQKYCSAQCRWRSHSRKRYEEREKEGVCPQCGKEMDHSATSSYCLSCQRYFHQRYMEKKRTKKQQKKDVLLQWSMGRQGYGRRAALEQEEGLSMREQLEHILREVQELWAGMDRMYEDDDGDIIQKFPDGRK